MNILYVLDNYYPKIDGPSIVLDNLATILTKNHLANVDLLVPKFPKYLDNSNFNIIRCKSISASEGYRASLPFLDCKIKKELKKKKYDIIHVHSPFTLGKFALKLGKKYNIPVINTVHTAYHSDFERKLKSKTLRKFMMGYINKTIKNSDYVFTVSKGFAIQLHTLPYNHEMPIGVVRNATDYIDSDLSIETQYIKNKHHIKKEFLFLFVGRIVENKNIQFSLECLKLLKEQGFKNFKFIIVGEGDYKDTLIELAKNYKLLDNVIFTGIIRDRNLLGAYYKISDLFMFPSTFDTCGIVSLEAGSFGLPSFMIEGSCAGELIEDEKNGFIAPENAKIWAEKLQKIVANKNKINKMKDYTRTSLNKSWEDITLEYYDVYKNIIFVHTLKNYHNKKGILLKKKFIKKANQKSKLQNKKHINKSCLRKGVYHIFKTIIKL